ncbi:hypothetical protein CANINC_004286 [Pichia inconspicua]|uniref:Fork-head domain-containing protein n=1 Tax=Pichia inconspicua TaxID=52247 RepID=A0A4T0WWG3_9ASCO|nr:hypothetical protein CANINC_004286 [[Candida] inconspicua]
MVDQSVSSSPLTMSSFEKSSTTSFSSNELTLLPPATLSSPVKRSHLKTPPSSTLRENNSSSLKNGNILSQQNSIERKNVNGLLSPEFSSPNLYASNIHISVISDSPVGKDDEKENNLPLPAPIFKKKRQADSSLNTSNKRSKHFKSNSSDFILPLPEEMPPINFTSDAKPPYSYATLIGMALLRSPERRLTLAEIYQWITDNFKYYKKGDVGWQNSIRHNLSLNKAFEKTEKSKEKKGHFWQIVPGYEHNYCNIKEIKRGSTSTNRKSIKCADPSTPKSLSTVNSDTDTYDDNDDDYDDDDDDEDNHIVELASVYTKKADSNFLQTPTLSEQYKLLNRRNLSHIYDNSLKHNRTISDGLNSIPELSMSLNASPIFVPFDASPSISRGAIGSSEFTSSFSCQSNFELSPMKLTDPDPIGPILEPMTPNKSNHRVQLPSISKHLTLPIPTLTSTENSNSFGILHPNLSSVQFKHSTPIRYTNTPISNNQNIPHSNNSKKLWASPSYLDDFYTSPITHGRKHSYQSKLYPPSSSQSSRNYHHRLIPSNIQLSPIPSVKRRLNMMNNGYSTNDIFGIDICTIHNNEYDDST